MFSAPLISPQTRPLPPIPSEEEKDHHTDRLQLRSVVAAGSGGSLNARRRVPRMGTRCHARLCVTSTQSTPSQQQQQQHDSCDSGKQTNRNSCEISTEGSSCEEGDIHPSSAPDYMKIALNYASICTDSRQQDSDDGY
ncbi:unnamed protein product, partial [Mesocestoides corti]